MAERKEYSEKVSQLLKIGSTASSTNQQWPNYPQQYGFEQADIPELIELATDENIYNEADTEEEVKTEADEPPARVWGPVHAWRTLGQLRAESAIEPLLAVLNWDDDWATEEIPQVYGLIGPAGIPALQGYIEANHEETYPAATAVLALENIGKNSPQASAEVGRVLTALLEKFADNDETLNAYLISSLAELNLKDSLPLIETVYQDKKADRTFINLDDVNHKFGLLSDEEYSKRQEQNRKQLLSKLGLADESSSKAAQNQIQSRKNQKAKAKVKRKMASASRKKNRKK